LGDSDRARIDIACEHIAMQQLRCRDRQYPCSRTDIEEPAKPMPPCQTLKCDQATASGGMLTGAKGGRRVDRDADSPSRNVAEIMRAVDKKPADSHRRKGELVLCQPVATRQPFLAGLDESAAGSGSGEREPRV
jgi:hypothetical protein